jgi:hypothetical protein
VFCYATGQIRLHLRPRRPHRQTLVMPIQARVAGVGFVLDPRGTYLGSADRAMRFVYLVDDRPGRKHAVNVAWEEGCQD